MRTLAYLGAFAAATVVAPAAQADSVVYLKGGNVWIAAPDGSGARQLTLHQYGWSSPSEADDGTVVAAGGLQRVNPGGTDSDGSDQLYRFHPDGNQIGGPIPTYGSYSTPSCPAYPPSRVRVSPDATRIAYGIYSCGDFGHMVALWTPSSATGLSFPDQTQGQVDFMNPAWIDSSTFTVSHNGPPVFGAHWGVHSVEAPDNTGPGWFDSHSPLDNMTADAVISRSGEEAVVFFNDAHDWTDGRPRNVRLVVYSNPSMPPDFSGAFGDPVCNVALDASQISDVLRLSPSLSPDGTKVVWGDDRGVEIASLDNTSNCASIAPRLLIPGGSQPFYAEGDERAPATDPVQPGVNLAPKPKVVRPANTKRPRITRSGKYLECSTGTWSHHPARYAYRWTISGKAKGASGRRLAITGRRRGHTARCSVTASNAAGRATATSLAFRMR